MRIDAQAGFVLHHYAYRETSLLVELFTRQHGRVAVVAKGARRTSSDFRGLLVPFQPLVLSWMGRGELATLTRAEPEMPPVSLRGDALFCGLYLNELLLRLTVRDDAHESIYHAYWQTLPALIDETKREAALRIFEKRLLQDLGYGLALERELDNGPVIEAPRQYRYLPERGVVAAGSSRLGVALSGAALIALQREQLDDPALLQECKLLLRTVLAHHMGNKPLHTRRLFQRKDSNTQ